jgi:hypothetical protein
MVRNVAGKQAIYMPICPPRNLPTEYYYSVSGRICGKKSTS